MKDKIIKDGPKAKAGEPALAFIYIGGATIS